MLNKTYGFVSFRVSTLSKDTEMTDNLESQKAAIAQKKERLEKKEKLLKQKERKLRTKRLIELGSLIEKIELNDLQGSALFGALLEIKEKSKNKDSIEAWTKKGKEFSARPFAVKQSPLAISFAHSPPEAILKILREKSFKWNRFRKEWYGFGDKKSLEDTLKNANATIEVLP